MALLTVESSQYETNTPKCWCKPRLFIFMLSSWEINNSDINHRAWKQKTSTGAKQTKPQPPCKPRVSYFVRPYLCLLGSHLHRPHCWATVSAPSWISFRLCSLCSLCLPTEDSSTRVTLGAVAPALASTLGRDGLSHSAKLTRRNWKWAGHLMGS